MTTCVMRCGKSAYGLLLDMKSDAEPKESRADRNNATTRRELAPSSKDSRLWRSGDGLQSVRLF